MFAAAVLGYLVISSFGTKRVRCEVCMQFNGGTDCRTASAETRENALRTAVTNACAQLSSGVTNPTSARTRRPLGALAALIPAPFSVRLLRVGGAVQPASRAPAGTPGCKINSELPGSIRRLFRVNSEKGRLAS